jgi:hypothetical protein
MLHFIYRQKFLSKIIKQKCHWPITNRTPIFIGANCMAGTAKYEGPDTSGFTEPVLCRNAYYGDLFV